MSELWQIVCKKCHFNMSAFVGFIVWIFINFRKWISLRINSESNLSFSFVRESIVIRNWLHRCLRNCDLQPTRGNNLSGVDVLVTTMRRGDPIIMTGVETYKCLHIYISSCPHTPIILKRKPPPSPPQVLLMSTAQGGIYKMSDISESACYYSMPYGSGYSSLSHTKLHSYYQTRLGWRMRCSN